MRVFQHSVMPTQPNAAYRSRSDASTSTFRSVATAIYF